jgi:hypothetical protein
MGFYSFICGKLGASRSVMRSSQAPAPQWSHRPTTARVQGHGDQTEVDQSVDRGMDQPAYFGFGTAARAPLQRGVVSSHGKFHGVVRVGLCRSLEPVYDLKWITASALRRNTVRVVRNAVGDDG